MGEAIATAQHNHRLYGVLSNIITEPLVADSSLCAVADGSQYSIDKDASSDCVDRAVVVLSPCLPIDGKLSCAAFYRCHLDVVPPATLCVIHLEKAMVVLELLRERNTPALPPPHLSYITASDWNLPSESENVVLLNTLRYTTQTPLQQYVLLVHTEFCTLPSCASSIFEVCVKRFGHAIPLVSTHIDYGGAHADEEEHHSNAYWCHVFCSKYRNTTPHGRSMKEIGDALRMAGVPSNTQLHFALSWCSTINMAALHRILNEDNNSRLIDCTGR
jgi:hypothetical protein